MHAGRQYNSTLGAAAKKGGMASAYQAQTGTKLEVLAGFGPPCGHLKPT